MTDPIAKLSNTFALKIKFGGGEAWITFKKPKANADIKPELADGTPEAWEKFLVKQITSIEGLQNEDGSPVTVEQLEKKDVPVDLWSVVVHGYLAGVNKPQTAEAAAKKFELLE